MWLRLQRYTCELTKKNRACLGYWSLNLDKDGHVNGQFNKKKKIQVTTVKDKLLQNRGKHESAFMRVLLEKHNISTYEKDLRSAGFWGLEEDFGLGLTGQ